MVPGTMRILPLVLMGAALTSCADRPRTFAEMTAVSPREVAEEDLLGNLSGAEYRLGVGDVLHVTVFRVESLSVREARIDASGNVQLPLLGPVAAAGLTAEELGADIRQRLAASYLQDPRVTVAVAEAASAKITVDGAVTEPGVYEMKGRTTLMQAVAMAKGASRVANLESVAVFRTSEGQRTVALFNLGDIRDGRAIDPILQGDDVVIVDTSQMSSRLRDIVSVLPAFSVFRPY